MDIPVDICIKSREEIGKREKERNRERERERERRKEREIEGKKREIWLGLGLSASLIQFSEGIQLKVTFSAKYFTSAVGALNLKLIKIPSILSLY